MSKSKYEVGDEVDLRVRVYHRRASVCEVFVVGGGVGRCAQVFDLGGDDLDCGKRVERPLKVGDTVLSIVPSGNDWCGEVKGLFDGFAWVWWTGGIRSSTPVEKLVRA